MKKSAALDTLVEINLLLRDNNKFSSKKSPHEKLFFDINLQYLCADNFCFQLDNLVANGHLYKHDKTSTVAAVEYQGHTWVIKRYNNQGFIHTLKLLAAGSRATHSFRDGLLLTKLGIPTPQPLLYALGFHLGFPHTGYIITKKSSGTTLHDLLMSGKLCRKTWPDIVLKTTQLVESIHALGITHGDIKQTNLLLDGDRLEIIDLDSLQVHRSQKNFNYHKNKDLKALKNRIDSDPDAYVAHKRIALGLV